MAVKHLYFVRHGQTAYNYLHKHQLLSTPLNARGIEQAHATASVLSSLPIDTLIASDAVRAVETARILQQAIAIPLSRDKIFREVQRPKNIAGARFWSIRSIVYTIRLYAFSSSKMWAYKDCENMRAVQARAKRALAQLSCLKGNHIVVVSHRLFISAMLAEILGKDVTKAFHHFWTMRSLRIIANGSITEVLYDSNATPTWTILRTHIIPPIEKPVA